MPTARTLAIYAAVTIVVIAVVWRVEAVRKMVIGA
jgi:hypothetical protein